MKWSWTGHTNRLKDDRWTSRVTTWRPYDKKRRQLSPAKRWGDDLDKYWSDTIILWQRTAQYRQWRGNDFSTGWSSVVCDPTFSSWGVATQKPDFQLISKRLLPKCVCLRGSAPDPAAWGGYSANMDVLQAEIGKEPPWVMLFADDLVICEHSRAEVEIQLERWRETFESHGLRVSRGKTEYIPCPERDQTIYIQEKEVKTVKTFKYLG